MITFTVKINLSRKSRIGSLHLSVARVTKKVCDAPFFWLLTLTEKQKNVRSPFAIVCWLDAMELVEQQSTMMAAMRVATTMKFAGGEDEELTASSSLL